MMLIGSVVIMIVVVIITHAVSTAATNIQLLTNRRRIQIAMNIMMLRYMVQMIASIMVSIVIIGVSISGSTDYAHAAVAPTHPQSAAVTATTTMGC